MADMRLIVAGAGGRMGRTLVKAIAETPGPMLAGATEGAGSPLIGQDSGVLAGLPPNGVIVTSECGRWPWQRRRRSRFHRAGRDREARGARRPDAARARHRHHRLSAEDDAKIAEAAKQAAIVKSGNMSLGVNLLAVLVRAGRQALDEELRHRDPRDAPQQQDRRAVRHRASARRGRRGRPRIDLKAALGARPRRPYRRAQARAISALPRCAAARWSASTA